MLLTVLALLALLAALGLWAWTGLLWVLPAAFIGAFLLLLVLAFLFLWAAAAVVRTDVPQQKDSPFYRCIINLYIEALMTLLRVRVKTSGLEKTPKEGRFLLVCNHLNEADPAILLHFFKKSQLAFISKRENDDMFIVGQVMHKIMCQLINRENDREALKTIIKCIQLIKEDHVSVAVFPEGYIHDDRKFHSFRHGVFKIAQKAQVPIVVCTIRGTERTFHNLKRFKPIDAELHLLEVIPAEALKGRTTVEVGEYIHGIMAADLGDAYKPEENT